MSVSLSEGLTKLSSLLEEAIAKLKTVQVTTEVTNIHRLVVEASTLTSQLYLTYESAASSDDSESLSDMEGSTPLPLKRSRAQYPLKYPRPKMPHYPNSSQA